MNHAVFFCDLQEPGIIYDFAEANPLCYRRKELAVWGGGVDPRKYMGFVYFRVVRDAGPHSRGRETGPKRRRHRFWVYLGSSTYPIE